MSDLVAGNGPGSLRVITFDRDGACTSPSARRAVWDDSASGDYTHVLVFAHGWNNDGQVAVRRFRAWHENTARVVDGPFHPLCVGILWPSTWLVLGGEDGPHPASSGSWDAAIGEFPAPLGPLLVEALRRPVVDAHGASTLADAAAAVTVVDDVSGDDAALDADAVLDLWAGLESDALVPVVDDFGPLLPESSSPTRAAALDPRDLVRVLSVWTMKDRARLVGARGVAAMLGVLLDRSAAPVHLVGHSYGAHLVLSALRENPSTVQAESALLLQPAVNHLCFGEHVVEGRPGGYHAVPDRVRQPVVSTYSCHDVPLTRVFHRALHRSRDLAEAAQWPKPPGPYAALGGYGPGGLAADARWVTSEAYLRQPHAPGFRVVAVDGSAVIPGHGRVTDPACCRLLATQLVHTEDR